MSYRWVQVTRLVVGGNNNEGKARQSLECKALVLFERNQRRDDREGCTNLWSPEILDPVVETE